MALSTLWKLGKFKALSRALKGKVQAVGTLECLWACSCQSGSDLIGTADDVESECNWKGKRGVLAKVLEDLRWIDVTPRGYTVHDFWDHAPGYVKRKRARLDLEHNNGQPKDRGRTDKGRTKCVPSIREWSGVTPLPPEGAGVEGTRCAAGSQAITPEQPNSEQRLLEPMPPEAAEFFASIAKIGTAPALREDAPVPEDRRELLERQKLVLLSGSGS